MTELLHVWAIAPAVLGTLCLVADRRRLWAPDLAASVLMLVAMADATFTAVVPVVYWAVLILAAAMALAALHRARRPTPPADTAMTVHATSGLVVMAALLVAMALDGHHTTATGQVHGGTSSSTLAIVVGSGVVAYTAASIGASVRARRWLDRAQYGGMGASALAMGVAVLL